MVNGGLQGLFAVNVTQTKDTTYVHMYCVMWHFLNLALCLVQ